MTQRPTDSFAYIAVFNLASYGRFERSFETNATGIYADTGGGPSAGHCMMLYLALEIRVQNPLQLTAVSPAFV